MIRRHALVATAAACVVAASFSVGSTYAAWSDFRTIEDNRVGAGTLVMTGGSDLTVPIAGPGSSGQDTLEVTNVGTTSATLGLALTLVDQPDGLCAGYDPVIHAGELSLFLDGISASSNPVSVASGDLCGGSLDLSWPGVDTLDTDELAAIDLRVELVDEPLFRWSGKTAVFKLEVTGQQPGGGFSDFTLGTFTVSVGDYAPDVPLDVDCPGTLGDYRVFHELPNGNDTLDLSGVTGPAYVLALSGVKEIVGTSQGDCIIIGNGDMTVRGGPGDDTIISRHPNSTAAGGGRASLFGEAGDDRLSARNGAALLNGGGGTDTCEAARGAQTIRNCETSPAASTSLSQSLTSVGTQELLEAEPEDPPTSEVETDPEPSELDTSPETTSKSSAEPGEEVTTEATSKDVATSTGADGAVDEDASISTEPEPETLEVEQ